LTAIGAVAGATPYDDTAVTRMELAAPGTVDSTQEDPVVAQLTTGADESDPFVTT
jgi:hypothetical protein